MQPTVGYMQPSMGPMQPMVAPSYMQSQGMPVPPREEVWPPPPSRTLPTRRSARPADMDSLISGQPVFHSLPTPVPGSQAATDLLQQQQAQWQAQQQAQAELLRQQSLHPSRLASCAQHQGQQLPMMDAHHMYQCGPRTIRYTRVPVPEANVGIVINNEFITQEHMVGKEIFPNDDAIRNDMWSHMGALIPRESSSKETLQDWLIHHAHYENAVDIKGLHQMEMHEAESSAAGSGRPSGRFLPDYHSLHRRRDDDGVWKTSQRVHQNFQRELLNEQQMREFWSNPVAVSLDE